MDIFFKNNFKIGRHLLGSENKTYFIAEAGSNHNGKIFPAVIENKNIVGIQFHPEKSGHHGIDFLKKYII